MRFHISYEDDGFSFEFGITAATRTPKFVEAVKWAMSQVPQGTAPTLVITDMGGQKIQVIKAIRTIFNMPLKEAKDIVESVLPVTLATPPNIEAASKLLQDAGASVEIR